MTDSTISRRSAELLDAAVAEFLLHGYAAVGVKEITERAGVSHGTFYNYFDSKRHMLSVLIGREASGLLGRLTSAAGILDDPVTVDGLRAAIETASARILADFDQQLDVYRFLLFEVPGVDAASFDEYLHLYREAIVRCVMILDRAQAAGLLNPELSLHDIAEGWIGYLAGMVAAMVNDLDVPNPAESARVIANLLLGGASRAGRSD